MKLDSQIRRLVDESRRLSASQETAIDLLIAGKSIAEAARTVGVSRQTVSRWVNHHPGFRAEHNTRRGELMAERADLVRELDVRSLGVIAEHLSDAPTFDQALAWVRARRIDLVDLSSIGPTDVELVVRAEVDDRSVPEADRILSMISVDTSRAEAWLDEQLDATSPGDSAGNGPADGPPS